MITLKQFHMDENLNLNNINSKAIIGDFEALWKFNLLEINLFLSIVSV